MEALVAQTTTHQVSRGVPDEVKNSFARFSYNKVGNGRK
jgi:hypothetical protein